MRKCPACGTQSSNNASFCENCGTRLSAQVPVENPPRPGHSPRARNLHCPECGGSNLSPIVESTNNGGVAVSTPASRRLGITSFQSTTTHRNYWVCQDCGHKFRNLQNLKEEIVAETQKLKVCQKCGIGILVFCILLGLIIANVPLAALLFAMPCLGLAVIDIMLWIIWFQTRNGITGMMEEKKYLETHCFSRER